MPRKAKKESDFVPLDAKSLSHATEVPFKSIDESKLITIEKQGKKTKIGKLKTRKISKQTETIEKFPEKTPKSKYILIITEKPQAAEKIASALGHAKKTSISGVNYYELERAGKKIIVACAVGHLFTLTSKEKGFPIFNISWIPSYTKNDWTKKYYSVLERLVKNASSFIVATDFDVEGEVIGLNIIRYIAKQKDAKRMKFSTLTKEELEESYEHVLPTLEWGQAIAGETRHFLDWMYGINLSRALMSAIKSQGKFKIMSIGRVQGPALKLIVDKEIEIQKFKPEPFWQIFIKLKTHKPLLKYEADITKKSELEKFKDLKGEKGISATEEKQRLLPPPTPFDLTTLQREAYRIIHFTPAKTLQIAQKLYLDGVISYPRTSSQKIPDSIKPLLILKKLSSKFPEIKYAVNKKPIEGKKSDPAHPSIFPTGEFKKLSADELKLYNLIVKRFISCFCESAKIQDKKITFITNKDKLKFKAAGLEIKEKNWLNVYPATLKEIEIETITGEKTIEKYSIEEKETQPPKRFTPASIITELEKRNLGTKATRTNIIETLYNRNYIKEQSIEATPLGLNLIKTLEQYSPIIIDEKLTREFEKDMEKIEKDGKDKEKEQEKILKKAENSIKEISADFKTKETKIGKGLVTATEENYAQEREDSIIGKCPACKQGNLRLIYNRKFKRSFIGCSAYPECKQTFSLPPGMIKRTDKKCDKCGFPMLMSLRAGKKPWFFCFNPNCPSNKEWQKKREEYLKNKKEED